MLLSVKRQRTAYAYRPIEVLDSDDEDDRVDRVIQRQRQASCPSHPLGIRPEGNRYLDALQASERGESFKDVRSLGLGKLAALSDDLLRNYILKRLPVTMVVRMEQVSRAWYALARHDEDWKDRVLDTFGGQFRYTGDWRKTFIQCFRPDFKLEERTPVLAKGIYSDQLYQPWYYASVELAAFVGADAPETVDRRHNLSLEDFIREYEQPNRPVIIADGAKHWPALTRWTKDELLKRYGKTIFRAERVDIQLEDYWNYAEQQCDESPLYLFDRDFTSRCPEMEQEFQVPVYFKEDLFSLFGAETRPDYRWLIIGPARSGSTFHKDPNATSAWNAVISGAKKWILFPPDTLPPGVYANQDESEVTAPVSVMEWFHHYYAVARRMKQPPLECVCREGEIMFVPHGWWHCVINLEHTVAITQNYVSRRNLDAVLKFVRERPEQISGLRGIVDEECGVEEDASTVNGSEGAPLTRDQFYERFCQVLCEAFPDEMPAVIQAEREAAAQCTLGRKRCWWEQLKAGPMDAKHHHEDESNQHTTDNTFRFGFTITEDD
jgi:oxalate decarboxylase/phosphoglucose isomerase-like protein (cupin superfamily)